ncbi:hypothetical protein WJX73_008180 [Symbiochloris irregularis]|uniref:cellulase n=1 Tax=Symbiochloris irregularis TaxID=706552 RepID=A0AAW1P7U5_9CHLO
MFAAMASRGIGRFITGARLVLGAHHVNWVAAELWAAEALAPVPWARTRAMSLDSILIRQNMTARGPLQSWRQSGANMGLSMGLPGAGVPEGKTGAGAGAGEIEGIADRGGQSAAGPSGNDERGIVAYNGGTPWRDEDAPPLKQWDGHLYQPPPKALPIVVGKSRKAVGPKDFAKGAAVEMDKMPAFTNVKHKTALPITKPPPPPPESGIEFKAQPYWKDSGTANPDGSMPTSTGMEGKDVKMYRRLRTLNTRGCLAMIVYLAALGFYIWVRVTKTLGLAQYTFYGVIVLIIELMGATTVILYGINLVWEPALEVYELDEEEEVDERGQLLPTTPSAQRPLRHNYHVRVLVPCYSEDVTILKRTCANALKAYLPPGCKRTVYLCDDKKDPEKRKWCEEMGPELVYVSGRKRPQGEMNGKSGNLNNVVGQLYPPGCVIPTQELLCVFDADQVPGRDFFLHTLWLFDGGENVGMVLSPQAFHNLNPYADLFNHSNIHFWEYMQPGYDSFGFISCTGTNFLMRAQALVEAGGSPTFTLTEDFALGMEMKKLHWHCRYVQAYLALGEAPEQIRNCFQQRSRWCKGHFQIIFNRQHCPLLQSQLSPFMRMYYASGVWSYVVGAVSTPFFIIVPMVTIWGGIFPIVVNWWAALGLTVYYVATNNVLFYVRNVQHVQALWFANTANSILWWTYVKACMRAVMTLVGASSITFKTTLKGRTAAVAGAIRDLWIHMLVVFGLGITVIAGLVKLFQGSYISTPLAISILWALYNIIPPALVLLYNPLRRTKYLQLVASCVMLLSFFCGITAVALMWRTSPAEYDHSSYLTNSLYFFRTQRLGHLPTTNGVPWRSDALTYELGPGSTDITGGWATGGDSGMLKMTMPHAFTTALLAWGLLSFPQGFAESGQTINAQAELTWGANYLLKAVGGTNVSYLISQVGSYPVDQAWWGRPEDMTMGRPYYASLTGSSDLAGAVVGGLAAASCALNQTDPTLSAQLLAAATKLYPYAKALTGTYSTATTTCANAVLASTVGTAGNVTYVTSETVQSAGPGQGTLEPLTDCSGANGQLYATLSQADPVAWGAAWMFYATGNSQYLDDYSTFYTLYYTNAVSLGSYATTPVFDPTHYIFASNVLLAQALNGPGKSTTPSSFYTQSKASLYQWICAASSQNQIRYTPAGRAYSLQSPFNGATGSATFLALAFSDVIRPFDRNLADIYLCWARSQARYFMGQTGRSYIVGEGTRPPVFIFEEASSCPTSAAVCNAANGLLNSKPNPWVCSGALVRGSGTEDPLIDNRVSKQTAVQVEYNAAWTGVMAGMVQAPEQFSQCLQSYSIFAANYTACPKLQEAPGSH